MTYTANAVGHFSQNYTENVAPSMKITGNFMLGRIAIIDWASIRPYFGRKMEENAS